MGLILYCSFSIHMEYLFVTGLKLYWFWKAFVAFKWINSVGFCSCILVIGVALFSWLGYEYQKQVFDEFLKLYPPKDPDPPECLCDPPDCDAPDCDWSDGSDWSDGEL